MIRLHPGSTALLVIDMQNDFCSNEGYYARTATDITPLARVAAPVSEILKRARNEGVQIVFTRLAYDSRRGSMEARHTILPTRWASPGERLKQGTWGAEIIDLLSPRPGEIIIDKAGYSAFEGTTLEEQLLEHGIKTVVLVGLVTYACVLATAFSAFDRDFDVVVAKDAVASWSSTLQTEACDVVDLLLGAAVEMDQISFRE